MKKYLLCFLILTIGMTNVKAQDVIITKGDEMIKAYNVEVGNNAVFYQLSNNPDADVKKIAKSEVFIIKLADGTKLDPNTDNHKEEHSKKEDDALIDQALVERPSDIRRRQELIDLYTVDIQAVTSNELDKNLRKDAARKKPKEHMIYAYYLWRPSATSMVCNEDLEFSIRTVLKDAGMGYEAWQRYFRFTLKNRSSKTIYVDLANTFDMWLNGDVNPHYTGLITTTSEGKTNGASFNLGGITNALGIGGAVGAVANATTVGGSKTTVNTTTKTEQRILSIPPGGKADIPGDVFPGFVIDSRIQQMCLDAYHWEGTVLDIPEEWVNAITFITTYSFKMDFSTYSTLDVKLVPFRVMPTGELWPQYFYEWKGKDYPVYIPSGNPLLTTNPIKEGEILSNAIIPPAK